jgi:hypothetical protein
MYREQVVEILRRRHVEVHVRQACVGRFGPRFCRREKKAGVARLRGLLLARRRKLFGRKLADGFEEAEAHFALRARRRLQKRLVAKRVQRVDDGWLRVERIAMKLAVTTCHARLADAARPPRA